MTNLLNMIPNCELQIRLRLNDPLQFRMIDTKMDDQMFFAETGNTGTNPPANDKFGKGNPQGIVVSLRSSLYLCFRFVLFLSSNSFEIRIKLRPELKFG